MRVLAHVMAPWNRTIKKEHITINHLNKYVGKAKNQNMINLANQ